MKVTIDIPKEYEKHFKKDRFKDSLQRLKADAGTYCMAGKYEIELCEMLIAAFANAEQQLFLCDPNKRSKCNNSPGCFMNGGECRLTQYKEYAMIDENGNAIMNEGE